MAQKVMQAAEADSISSRIQDLQSAYVEQLAAEADAKAWATDFDFLAQSRKAKSREELLRLMYQGLDRVMVNADGSLDVLWKFEDVLVD